MLRNLVLRRDLIIGIGAVVVVIVAVSIYLYSPQTQRTTGVPVSREIEVELNDYYFKPKTISIPLGEAVRIVLKNVGRSTHTFTIDELGINMRLAPGETKSIEITASKAGSYVLYCIPHRALGMVGNFTVTLKS
jgi:plastocyanin